MACELNNDFDIRAAPHNGQIMEAGSCEMMAAVFSRIVQVMRGQTEAGIRWWEQGSGEEYINLRWAQESLRKYFPDV